MKRRLFATLLVILLLTGCGAERKEEQVPAGEMSLPESTYEEESSGELSTVYLLKPEWNEYDPSVDRIWFTVENLSGGMMVTGMEYSLETLGDNGSWYQVPFREDVGWESILLGVQDGRKQAFSCWMPMFDYDFSNGGTYRIVKTIGEEICAGEFKLVEGADISAETPYGYAPLEELPEDYSPIRIMDGPDEIDLDAGVIFDGEGAYGVEQVAAFLEKNGLGIPCQLRTFQDYGEGAVMTIDVIFENGSYLWRMRQENAVTEQRFAYIVTDGSAIYLANGADWEHSQLYDSDKAFLVPEGQCRDLIPALEQGISARLEDNVTRYRIWSADGMRCAGLATQEYSSPTEFLVTWQKPGEGSGGSMYDLQNWDGLETAITAMEWQENGTLKLTCDTLEGRVNTLYFDPETETLMYR